MSEKADINGAKVVLKDQETVFLTSRKYKICAVLAENPGYTHQKIADKLKISEGIVARELAEIYKSTSYKNKFALSCAVAKNPERFVEKKEFGIRPLTETEEQLFVTLAMNLTDDVDSIAKNMGISSYDLMDHLKKLSDKIDTNGERGFLHSIQEKARQLIADLNKNGDFIKKKQLLQWESLRKIGCEYNLAAYGLTKKEHKICEAIGLNPEKRMTEISKVLHISAPTLRNHLTNIYKKTGIKNRCELHEMLQGTASRFPQDLADRCAEHYKLTRSEKKVFVLLVSNPSYTNKEIALELGFSEPAIRNHLDNIFTKMHVNNRHACVQAFRKYVAALPPVNVADNNGGPE